jgi:hypothetical protein
VFVVVGLGVDEFDEVLDFPLEQLANVPVSRAASTSATAALGFTTSVLSIAHKCLARTEQFDRPGRGLGSGWDNWLCAFVA